MVNSKYIHTITQIELEDFCKVFAAGSVVKLEEVPSILTSNPSLLNKFIGGYAYSGTSLSIGFSIFRHDEKDELKGFPVNENRFIFSAGSILEIQPPFENHWKREVPEEWRVKSHP